MTRFKLCWKTSQRLEEEICVRGERSLEQATQERTERENVLSAARAALEQQREFAGNLR